MSASATTRAFPVSTRLDASSVPRPPQPSKPTRTAEFAAVPRTNVGRMSIAPAVAAATPMNLRRSSSLEKFGRFASFVMFSSRRRVLPDQVLQVCLRIANVRHLLRSGNLPLNGDRAAIVELLQPFDNSGKIHFALADGDLLAEFPRVRRPHSILRVDSLDIRAEEFNGVHGICLAVEYQVREIEVHALIVEPYVLNRAHERDGRLLAGLVAEILPIVSAVANHLSQRCDRFLVDRIIGILRDESAMRLYGLDATLFGKI